MSSSKDLTIFVTISTILIASALPTDKKLKTIGPCVNSLCPFGYECKDNECIKNQIVLKNLASDESIGPCINNLCPENHTCYDELCYNTIKLINLS